MKTRRFTPEDQRLFAELSGDYNPMHVDPIFARRLILGKPVVHGIHILLWALDLWLAERSAPVALTGLEVVFHAPLGTGEALSFTLTESADQMVRIQLSKDGNRTATITARFSAQDTPLLTLPTDNPNNRSCRDLPVEALERHGGATILFFSPEHAAEMLPNATRVLPAGQLAAILATSRIVGMECPGLHSIFAELKILFQPGQAGHPELGFQVAGCDRRFSLVQLDLTGPGISGSIKAFLRPPPQQQQGMDKMRQVVEPEEFSTIRALVIGGSRGLGEVTAKLLAAGGADVVLTYHQGEVEAREIVREITSAGGKANSLPFDVLAPAPGIAAALDGHFTPSHLFYLATPPIFVAAKGSFNPQLFQTFCDYYVTGFHGIINGLRRQGALPLQVFYPSSVAIDELPLNMGEYAAAKGGGEILCAFLNKSVKGLTIHAPRLPRLATDQTASFLPVDNQDPVPILLPIIREMT